MENETKLVDNASEPVMMDGVNLLALPECLALLKGYMNESKAKELAEFYSNNLEHYDCISKDGSRVLFILRVAPVDMNWLFKSHGWPSGKPEVEYPLVYNDYTIPKQGDWSLCVDAILSVKDESGEWKDVELPGDRLFGCFLWEVIEGYEVGEIKIKQDE